MGAGLFLCTSPEPERARAVEQVSLCPAPAGGMCPGTQTSQAPHSPVTIRGNRPSGWTCLSDGETSAIHKHVQTTTGQAQGSGAHMMGPGGLEVEGAGLPAVTKLTTGKSQGLTAGRPVQCRHHLCPWLAITPSGLNGCRVPGSRRHGWAQPLQGAPGDRESGLECANLPDSMEHPAVPRPVAACQVQALVWSQREHGQCLSQEESGEAGRPSK